jgi:hypothetical protein
LKHTLPLLVLAAAMGASAQDIPERNPLAPTAIGVHVASFHTERIDETSGKPWNNANVGVYAKWDRWVGGAYYNSIRQTSVYAGYAYPLFDNLDIVVGVVTGYDGPGYSAKAIMPMVIPSAHFAITPDISVRVNLALGVQKGAATAVNFALEWKLP